MKFSKFIIGLATGIVGFWLGLYSALHFANEKIFIMLYALFVSAIFSSISIWGFNQIKNKEIKRILPMCICILCIALAILSLKQMRLM